MEISLNFNKTVEENAAIYFEKAKKAKKKSEGAKEAVDLYKKKLEKVKHTHSKEIEEKKEQVKQIRKKRKTEWYEKFRWFISSEGFLVIGGRDATTNEIVIKKHTDKDDLVFHTDMAGSPFFVVKTKGKKPGKATIEETANATACYSRAWKSGLLTLAVFYVKPDQVSKQANSGEFMAKGAFMIRGKTNYVTPIDMKLGIGPYKDTLMSAPINSIKKHTKEFFTIIQGKTKPSDIAKKVKAKFKTGTLDEIIRILPSGGCEIK